MKFFLCTFIILSTLYAQSQDLNCTNFKDGKFKIVDNNVGRYILERKGSKQIEYAEDSRLKVLFKVTWLNDCTYTLELKKVLENPTEVKFPSSLFVTVEIIETTENSYIQRCTSNLSDLEYQNEMIRIK